MRLKVILGSIVAVAILVAGCGGGGGDTSGGTTAGSAGATTNVKSGGSSEPLSKKEFIKQGDKICTKVPEAYAKELRVLEEKNIAKKKGEPSPAEINLNAAVPPIYVAVEELEELTPPAGDEAEAKAMIGALETAAKGIEEKPTSPLTGPESPYDEFQKLTKKYGFKTCNLL